jgi:CheY-like chemotaxis protein
MLTDRIIPEDLKEKINILVVEDNLLGRKLSSFLLEKWGFHYDTCSNGKQALENLKIKKYDLILMDIQMPEMDGHETTKYIRQKLKLGLPIIAMTSHATEEERKKCLSSGMNDYLAKPIVEEELYNLTVNYLFSTVVEAPENKMKER